jgi:hypothetical protein
MERGRVFGRRGIFKSLEVKASLLVAYLWIWVFRTPSRYCPIRNGIYLMFC